MDELFNNLNVPDYIADEILDYIYQTSQGKCKCMKWKNIKALLRLAIVNNRLTKEQAEFLEKEFCKEKTLKKNGKI